LRMWPFMPTPFFLTRTLVDQQGVRFALKRPNRKRFERTGSTGFLPLRDLLGVALPAYDCGRRTAATGSRQRPRQRLCAG
jgi:hypothetical protein